MCGVGLIILYLDTYLLFKSCSVSVSLSTSDKLVSKSAMLAGSSTAWSMESSLMDKCHLTRPLEAAMIPSILSLVRLELESMSPVQSLLIWNPL